MCAPPCPARSWRFYSLKNLCILFFKEFWLRLLFPSFVDDWNKKPTQIHLSRKENMFSFITKRTRERVVGIAGSRVSNYCLWSDFSISQHQPYGGDQGKWSWEISGLPFPYSSQPTRRQWSLSPSVYLTMQSKHRMVLTWSQAPEPSAADPRRRKMGTNLGISNGSVPTGSYQL